MNDNATYTPIGFHMRMILNRLRNKQQIDGAEEQGRQAEGHEAEDPGCELHVRFTDKKPGAELTGVEPTGRRKVGN